MQFDHFLSPYTHRYEKLTLRIRVSLFFKHAWNCIKTIFSEAPKYVVIGELKKDIDHGSEPPQDNVVLGLASENAKRRDINAKEDGSTVEAASVEVEAER